jgi:hypothetical protein
MSGPLASPQARATGAHHEHTLGAYPHAPGLLANNLTPASSALFEAGFSPAIQSRFHKQSNG